MCISTPKKKPSFLSFYIFRPGGLKTSPLLWSTARPSGEGAHQGTIGGQKETSLHRSRTEFTTLNASEIGVLFVKQKNKATLHILCLLAAAKPSVRLYNYVTRDPTHPKWICSEEFRRDKLKDWRILPSPPKLSSGWDPLVIANFFQGGIHCSKSRIVFEVPWNFQLDSFHSITFSMPQVFEQSLFLCWRENFFWPFFSIFFLFLLSAFFGAVAAASSGLPWTGPRSRFPAADGRSPWGSFARWRTLTGTGGGAGTGGGGGCLNDSDQVCPSSMLCKKRYIWKV